MSVAEPEISPTPLLSDQRLADVVRELHMLAQSRAALAQHIETDLKDALTQAEEDIERARRDLPASRDEHLAQEQRSFEDKRRIIFERFEREYGTLQEDFDRLVTEANAAADHVLRTEKRQLEEARWNAEAVYEAVKNEPARKLEEFCKHAEAWAERLRAEWQNVLVILTNWQLTELAATPVPPSAVTPEYRTPSDRLQQLLAELVAARENLARQRLPDLAVGPLPILGTIGLTLVLMFPAWLLTRSPVALVLTVIVAAVIGVLARLSLQRKAFAAAEAAFLPAAQIMADAEAFLPRCVADQRALCERKQMENLATRDQAIEHAQQHANTTIDNALRERDALLDEYQSFYPPRMHQHVAERDAATRQLNEAHRLQVEALQRECGAQLEEAEAHYRQALEEAHAGHRSQRQALEDSWNAGLERLRATVTALHQETNRVCPPWDVLAHEDWTGLDEVPSAIRLGSLTVGLRRPVKEPQASDLKPDVPELPLEPRFELPALVQAPTNLSLLLEARGDGRRAAIRTMQAYLLRLLTSLPPAKCRLTILDPVGLGENFAAFMHLADYDDQLISRRIWTEPRHIEQRLTDLSEHMENVIQKYLRNEFKTIDEYNRDAGEVAEPFRFLVAANFPANFSEAAARRLLSIAASGPRCGVFVLLAVDSEMPLPAGFSLADLRQHTNALVWRRDRFVGRTGLMAEFPLELDSPPQDEVATRILHNVGRQARSAGRVEVPFEAICPPAEAYWTQSARTGLDVPLGRAGATRLQALQLGSGTSQHVLVAGKTGSGKSTLLHALITSIALRYSPDEVELYLVDFKQGVEFKTYATHELPHARVIAIESDREFGLSVLEKLDAELRRRAEAFREQEVQDLAGYREARPDSPMPRILLVVDEFQEFFTEDDRTSHEAALLLDRLVRQGRAFGIHILLGSQTLAGAYSLARSTLGQMAVRIAMQCSEADAHLILSEDNTAARLLSRPGEAIYNDSNGLVEGNHPFQVVWLPDDRREHFLQQVIEQAQSKGLPARPRVVFEGNVPADLPGNHRLQEVLAQAPADIPADAALSVWLGDPVSIKDPTAAYFQPHSGSNLLIVGQHEDAALGMFVSTVVSLWAQRNVPTATEKPDAAAPAETSPARFTLLDGATHRSHAAQTLAELGRRLGSNFRRAAGREIATVLEQLGAEVTRRQQSPQSTDTPRFLLVYGVQSLRDLRKDDDDFGYMRAGEEKPLTPAKQLVNILREGPAVGVHVLCWCDTLNNLNRTFDRQTLKEFEQRVLLQMSATDSSTLIDSPAASKLGTTRALLADDAQNRLEKFRPYRVPPADWLDGVLRADG